MGVLSKPVLTKPICLYQSGTKSLTLQLDEFGEAKLEIFNLQGRRFYTGTQTSGTHRLSVDFLPNGVYMVKLIHANKKVNTTKIVVK